jgi:hypothetical protein
LLLLLEMIQCYYYTTECRGDGGGNEGHDRGYGSSEEMMSRRNDKKIEKMKSHFTIWAMLIPKYNR